MPPQSMAPVSGVFPADGLLRLLGIGISGNPAGVKFPLCSTLAVVPLACGSLSGWSRVWTGGVWVGLCGCGRRGLEGDGEAELFELGY